MAQAIVGLWLEDDDTADCWRSKAFDDAGGEYTLDAWQAPSGRWHWDLTDVVHPDHYDSGVEDDLDDAMVAAEEALRCMVGEASDEP